MDDLIEWTLEHVAYSGSRGVPIADLWVAVEEYYDSRGLTQLLDTSFQEYLWSLLIQCEDFLVCHQSPRTGEALEIHVLSESLHDLSALESRYAQDLVIRTTEERQWLTLTGHAKDDRIAPPKVFACLSAISASRTAGLSLIDLYRQTGQDKRSAPARCKKLVDQGFVHGFPVLVEGSNTTLYVHDHFLAENLRQRGQQGGRSMVTDLHNVRLGISSLLLESTNQILKTRDCCTQLRMDTQQSDSWTQSRFYRQLRLLAKHRIVRLISVPGLKTGSLISCVQLLRPYTESDMFILQSNAKDDRSDGKEVQDDSDNEAELDPLLLKEECDEELDLSNSVVVQESTSDFHEMSMTRDDILERNILQLAQDSGETGISGPDIARRLVGSFWTRPLDELMKKMCPDISRATQPAQYSSLALGPAVEEVTGKTRQYRYYTRQQACKIGLLDRQYFSEHELSDGILPRISSGLRLMNKAPCSDERAATKRPGRGRPRKIAREVDNSTASDRERDQQADKDPGGTCLQNISNALLSSSGIVPMKRKRGRPSKAMLQQREAALLSQTAESVQSQNQITTASHTDTLSDHLSHEEDPDIMNRESAPRSTVVTETLPAIPVVSQNPGSDLANTQTVSQLHLKHRRPGRETLRRGIINGTMNKRKAILLSIIKSHGGIVSFDRELLDEFNILAQKESGILQTTDKNTLRRTLDDMVHQTTLRSIVRSFDGFNGNHRIRRDIYMLREIAPDGAQELSFIQDVKVKESLRRQNITYGRQIHPVVPRPEMEVLPLDSERRAHQRVLDKLSAPFGSAISDLRVRLASKDTIDSPVTQDHVYAGSLNVTTWIQGRLAERNAAEEAQKKEIAMAAEQRRAKAKLNTRRFRPPIKKIPSVAQSNLRRSRNIDKNASASLEEDRSEQGEEDPQDSDNSSDYDRGNDTTESLAQSVTAKPVGKVAAKRSDRFAEDDLSGEDQDSIPISRNRTSQFTEFEDDTLIRAAHLSMLFFSNSEVDSQIDWAVVQHALRNKNDIDCRKRYAVIRHKSKHRTVQSFLACEVFRQAYNENVRKNLIKAVPRHCKSPSGELFDLGPLIQFSRQFDPDRQSLFTQTLPTDLDDLYSKYDIVSQLDEDAVWTDAYFLASTSANKKDILNANSFQFTDDEAGSSLSYVQEADKFSVLRSAIKSSLLTDDSVYDVESGTSALLQYGSEAELEEITQKMKEENLIVGLKNDGSGQPGRILAISNRFVQYFKSAISTKTMQLASTFESSVREAFAEGKTHQHPPLAKNGEVLATLEMALRGYLYLAQGQKKWSTHGLIDDYWVRQIDASLLDFDVLLQPRGQVQSSNQRIVGQTKTIDPPCFWINIHGQRMSSVYRSALCLVLNFLVLRGVVEFRELLRLCEPVFESHELQRCLLDLEEGQYIEAINGSYNVTGTYYKALE